jgi:glycosyltransferase involved in cell wall biosynthesis
MPRMKRKFGIYNLHMRAMGGGEKLALVLAEHLSLTNDVSLFCAEPLDKSKLEHFFGVDLSRVRINPLDDHGPVPKLLGRLRGDSTSSLSQHHYQQLRKLDLDVFINNSYGSELLSPAPHGLFMCMFPHSTTQPKRAVIDSYSTVVAISRYSAEWVRRRWQRDTQVIYPPCDDMGPSTQKEKMILHVGRFLADSNEDERHHKSQGVLLNTFKQMTDLHREGWTLHFAGSRGGDTSFADSLARSAPGFPVFFHFNSPREELRELYRKAAIYWHATGFGFQTDSYPGKQEHFGITTVEAMSAAAVPVVYASGGQTEVVSNEVYGFCWNDLEQLSGYTRKLANDAELRRRLGQQAVIASRRFSRETFAEAIDRLMLKILEAPNAQTLA